VWLSQSLLSMPSDTVSWWCSKCYKLNFMYVSRTMMVRYFVIWCSGVRHIILMWIIFCQVHLRSGAQHGRHLLHNYSQQVRTYAVDVWSGPRCVQIQENIRYAWQWLLEFSREMRRLSVNVLNLQQMCSLLTRLMGDESESWIKLYHCKWLMESRDQKTGLICNNGEIQSQKL
jgi:hypothetical protein